MAEHRVDTCIICHNTSGEERAFLWIDKCGHGFCHGCLQRNRNYNSNQCPHCRQHYKSKSLKPYKTGPVEPSKVAEVVIDLTGSDVIDLTSCDDVINMTGQD